MNELIDCDLMPFGIHKGKKLVDVPASYLLYLYDDDLTHAPLREYIKDNYDVLLEELKRNKNKQL